MQFSAADADIEDMGSKRRVLFIFALVGAMVINTAATALADGGSSSHLDLDEHFEGWFSNGMVNDAAACGPFAASEDAVVWHLFADLPQQSAEISTEDVDVSLDFGGSVATDVRFEVSADRVDIWARVAVKDPSKDAYVRQGAHTSIEKVRVKFATEDVVVANASVQLGNVCYSGLGPIGEITIYLQGMMCDGFDRFEGNEINDASSGWDSTAGDWQLWDKIFKNNAPTVKVAGKTKGCSFSGTQRFALGTSASMTGYYEVPGTTDAANTGLIKISSRDLPEAQQRALFWATEELWVQRLDNQRLGAFQCYDDRLHPDNYEWILIRDYNKLPSDITCIAWNVSDISG